MVKAVFATGSRKRFSDNLCIVWGALSELEMKSVIFFLAITAICQRSDSKQITMLELK